MVLGVCSIRAKAKEHCILQTQTPRQSGATSFCLGVSACGVQSPLHATWQMQPPAACFQHHATSCNHPCTAPGQARTFVMPTEPEVAPASRSAGSGGMCAEGGGPMPFGEGLRGGMPLGWGLGVGEVSSAMWWRRVTSSAAMAADPSLSFRCSACTHSQLLLMLVLQQCYMLTQPHKRPLRWHQEGRVYYAHWQPHAVQC